MPIEPLQARAAALGVADRISWDLRFVSDAEAAAAFARATVICLPYREIENSGVLAEALRHGVVPVTTRGRAGCRRSSRATSFPRRCPSTTPAALAGRLGEALTDAALRARATAGMATSAARAHVGARRRDAREALSRGARAALEPRRVESRDAVGTRRAAHGRSRLRVYDSPAGPPDALALLWQHGSPATGAPIEPLRAAAEARGIRLVTYARPSYGGSSPLPGRNVASAAGDVAQIADALGIERLAVVGYSGGGPHALACAALLPELVTGAVVVACPAPFDGSDDWFAGMAAPGGLRAAAAGREARRRHAESDEFDPSIFVAADWAALEGEWSSLGGRRRRGRCCGARWADRRRRGVRVSVGVRSRAHLGAAAGRAGRRRPRDTGGACRAHREGVRERGGLVEARGGARVGARGAAGCARVGGSAPAELIGDGHPGSKIGPPGFEDRPSERGCTPVQVACTTFPIRRSTCRVMALPNKSNCQPPRSHQSALGTLGSVPGEINRLRRPSAGSQARTRARAGHPQAAARLAGAKPRRVCSSRDHTPFARRARARSPVQSSPHRPRARRAASDAARRSATRRSPSSPRRRCRPRSAWRPISTCRPRRPRSTCSPSCVRSGSGTAS